MGDPLDQAAANKSASRRFASHSPSGMKSCPLAQKLVLGVFFDGTDNNRHRDTPKKTQTNIARLYDMYKHSQYRHYEIGIGAAEVSWKKKVAFGIIPKVLESVKQASGSGGKARLNGAYAFVEACVAKVARDQEAVVDVFGFSRGAALARTFTNLIVQGLAKKYPKLRVRFLGLFDTVASFDNIKVGETSMSNYRAEQCLHVDKSAADRIVHIVANNECREKFPLSVISGTVRTCAGAHSDIGGGYAPGDDGRLNHLAAITLSWMYDEAEKMGVPLKPLWPLKDFGVVSKRGLEALVQWMWQMNIPAGGLIFKEDECTPPSFGWLGVDMPVKRSNFPQLWDDQKNFIAQYIHRSHSTDLMALTPPTPDFLRRHENWAPRTLVNLPPNFSWKGYLKSAHGPVIPPSPRDRARIQERLGVPVPSSTANRSKRQK